MSKGNINYKYLRRRKSWFRRNLGLVIVWAVIAVVVILLGIFGSMKIFGYGIFKNKNSNVSEKEEIKEEIICTIKRKIFTLKIEDVESIKSY